jgi:hypothetical protein
VRLVLTYNLILSLLVGPLLCCCTAARVAHEGVATRPVSSSAPKSQRKHCCGEPRSDDGSQKSPAKKPSAPGKCPCKGADSKVAAVEPPAASLASLSLLAFPVLFYNPPVVDRLPLVLGANPQFDHRSSTLSASDILYAHHKLRC